MSLPAPNLDDRRAQELVDEAKRYLQHRWPEWTGWTDHNVSDPGVTLIETFAHMVDQLIYRLNRVPERTYVKLLELIGIRLFPPTPASTRVTFWLSSRGTTTVQVPRCTEVATERTTSQSAVVFRTSEPLDIVPVELEAFGSQTSGTDSFVDLTIPLTNSSEVSLFSATPQPGDAFYVGLTRPAPRCAVALAVSGEVEGHGIRPESPPRAWQAWTGNGWENCEIERDETGGFNQRGTVVIHLPDVHAELRIGDHTSAWLRCIVTPVGEGQTPYGASPRIRHLDVYTVGGTIDASHSEEVLGEELGISEGVFGQVFRVEHPPVVLTSDSEVIEEHRFEARPEDPPLEWQRVDSFAESEADQRCFTIDAATGEVRFPPVLREADGSVRRTGDAPAAKSRLMLRAYRTGGGRIGNVAAHAIRRLRSSVPGVATVDNRVPAVGGVDAETIEEAKVRGPLELQTRDRAVTAADFEYLARSAAPEVARVVCPPPEDSGPGVVRVLVVPHLPGPEHGAIPLQLTRPARDVVERIGAELDERRVVGVRVVVERPSYQGLVVFARLLARRHEDPDEVERRALVALHRYYHPVVGGPEGGGWPFGRPVRAAEVFGVLQAVPGVERVEESQLYAVDLQTNERVDNELDRIDLSPTTLVLSQRHRLEVEAIR
jgi:predicted phage baseplate assembly protein